MIRSLVEGLFGLSDLDNHLFINSFAKFPVIVDLGAGKGEFTQKLSKKYPSSRIISVEPDPSLFRELKREFQNQSNVELLNAAVGNQSTDKCKFYLNKNWQGNSLHKSLMSETDLENEIIVRLVTLNDIFSIFNFEKIDLLKVDIEGEEWRLFENFSKNDFEKIFQISVEFHDFIDPSLTSKSARCVKLLEQLGYTFVSKSGLTSGSPYYSCLFYDRRRLKRTSSAKARFRNFLFSSKG